MRLGIEHVVLFSNEIHGARQRVEQSGIALFGQGYYLVAHKGAKSVDVSIGGILAPARTRLIGYGHSALFDRGAQLFAPLFQKRVAYAAALQLSAVSHGAKPAWPGAHDRAHIKGFHPVIGSMGGKDAALVRSASRPLAQLF